MHHSRARQIAFHMRRLRPVPIHSRWATWLALAAAILALIPMMGRAMAPLAIVDPDAPSPANRTNAVIAQGVAGPPAASVAWRIVRDTAEPTGVAEYQDRALGFVYADSAPILLTDAAGNQVRLGAGEGAFVPDDISQLRESLTGAPASYLRISLVPAEAAADGGGDTLIFGSNPFDAPGGPSDLDLVYGTATTSALDEVGVTGHSPLLVYAIDGDLEVTLHEGTQIPVSAGEASVFPSPILVRSTGPDGSDAAYLAATLGAEVSPPPPTADIDQSPSIPLPDPADSSSASLPTIDINLAVCPADFVYPTGGQGTVQCDNAAPIPGATVVLTPEEDGATSLLVKRMRPETSTSPIWGRRLTSSRSTLPSTRSSSTTASAIPLPGLAPAAAQRRTAHHSGSSVAWPAFPSVPRPHPSSAPSRPSTPTRPPRTILARRRSRRSIRLRHRRDRR